MSDDLQKTGEGRPAPIASTGQPKTWRWGAGRGKAAWRLKLLGALRGQGVLIWSGGKVSAAYELDVFARGDSHSVSGQLQGSFAALARETRRIGAPPTGAKLRLADGREIEVELGSVDSGAVAVDASGPSVDVDLFATAS